jgi:5-methylcytosine-specific restriction endonuclease McrA
MIEHETLTKSQVIKIGRIIGKCQDCGCLGEIQAHRINRGYAGGKYVIRNLYYLCEKCHKERHEMERMGRKG